MVYSMAAADVQQPEQPEQAALRAEMQDWMTYPVFMRCTMWDTFFSEETQLKKIEMILQAMVDMGLRHPSERTLCMACALIVRMPLQAPAPQPSANKDRIELAQALLSTAFREMLR